MGPLQDPYSVAIAPEGSWAIFGSHTSAQAWNLETKSPLFSVIQGGNYNKIENPALKTSVAPAIFFPNYCSVSPDSSKVLLVGNHRGLSAATIIGSNGEMIGTFQQIPNYINGGAWVEGDNVLFWSDDQLSLYDSKSYRLSASLRTENIADNLGANSAGYKYPFNSSYCKNSKLFATSLNNGSICLYAVSSESIKKVVAVNIDPQGGLAAYTDDFFYIMRGGAFRNLHFADLNGYQTYPFEQFDLRLNRPDIVLDRLGAPKEAIDAAKTLREKRLKKMNVTEEMLQPDFHLPEVALTSEIPSTTSSDQIDLKIKATDDEYPLERLRVYVNNVPINGTEEESLRDQKTQFLERTIPIKLASGRNKSRSLSSTAREPSPSTPIQRSPARPRPKPTLYVVSMGVSQYANPDNNLKYAAKDAEDLAKKLKDRAGSLYGEVKELVLKDQDVSRENLAKVRISSSPPQSTTRSSSFMAGHGLLDEKYDYVLRHEQRRPGPSRDPRHPLRGNGRDPGESSLS